MPVRAIEPKDIPEVLSLGYQMHQESTYRQFDYDENKFGRLLYHYMSSPTQRFAYVSTRGHDVTGVFLGSIDAHYFGNDKIASDTLWYVTPKTRGSRAGIQLLRAYENWAKRQGASAIYVGISSGITPERTGNMMQKLGYDVAAGNFKLRVVT